MERADFESLSCQIKFPTSKDNSELNSLRLAFEQDELDFPQTAPLDNSELDLLLVEPASTRKTGERAGFPPGTTPKLKSVIVYGENNNKACKVNKG